jgi:hypothetical protein
MAIPAAAVSPFGPDLSGFTDDPEGTVARIRDDLDELHRAVSTLAETAGAGEEGPTGPAGPAGPAGPPGESAEGAVTGPDTSTDNAVVRWDGATGTVIQDYDPGRGGIEPTVSDGGVLNCKVQSKHEGGIDLVEDGRVTATVIDGGGFTAFDLRDRTSRSSGNAFLLRNIADDKELMKIFWDGKLVLGYTDSIGQFPNALMSFIYNDLNTEKVEVGMAGLLNHADTGVTLARMAGFAGAGIVTTHTGLSSNLVSGVVGAGICGADTANYAGKVLAGVFGNTGSSATSSDIVPADVDGGAGYLVDAVRGNWDHVSTFFGNAQANNPITGGNPTNTPSVCSVLRAVIPEATTGEAWCIYGDTLSPLIYTNPTTKYYNYYGAPLVASVAGFARIPFPRHGSRRTHLYFIPGDLDDAGSSVFGDVVFDDGDGTTLEGLWEHDGTAFRKLVPQNDHTATVTGSTATIGGIGSGPAGTAQVGWVEIKIDDGTAGGRLGWVPYWQ